MECDHEWEKIEVTKVHVLENSDGEPIIILDPDSSSFIGCGKCELSLDEVYV